ncbi:hypothetical protein LINPERPRIM_LOCUS34150 [Linum perenne]
MEYFIIFGAYLTCSLLQRVSINTHGFLQFKTHFSIYELSLPNRVFFFFSRSSLSLECVKKDTRGKIDE